MVNEICRWSHYRITVDCVSELPPYRIRKRRAGGRAEEKQRKTRNKGRGKKGSQIETGISDDKITRLIL
jgi:hypothetical protein